MLRLRSNRLRLFCALLLVLHGATVAAPAVASDVDLPAVLHLLDAIGLSQYRSLFEQRHIDAARSSLAAITSEQLKDHGVAALGHRKKLLKHLHELAHAAGGSQCEAEDLLTSRSECIGSQQQQQPPASALKSVHPPAGSDPHQRSHLAHGVEDDDTSEDNAGWQYEPERHAYDTDRCTIDRRSYDDLTPEEFYSEFYLKKPVLILPNRERAERIRRTRAHWSKEHLQREHGAFEVTLGTPQQLTAFGDGRVNVTLKEYIQQISRAASSSASDAAASSSSSASASSRISQTHYLFDRNRFFLHNPSLLATYEAPVYFRPGAQAQAKAGDSESHPEIWSPTLTFALGPTGSGINFHYHKDGWNEVLHGRKRWFMYAPSVGVPPFGYNQYEPAERWFHANYDALLQQPAADPRRLPLECVQYPGETMYVPEDWYHATINIGETIAVAGQALQPSRGTLMDHVTRGLSKSAAAPPGDDRASGLKEFQRALDKYPGFAQVYNLIGNLHRSVGAEAAGAAAGGGDGARSRAATSAAMEAYRLAVHFNPKYAMAWASLGQLQLQQGEYADALVSFRHADTLGPDQYDTVLGLGNALYFTGSLDEAAQVLNHSIQVFLGQEDEQMDWSPARASFVNLAVVYSALNQPERALEVGARWMARVDRDSLMTMAYARALRQLHRYAEAQQRYRDLLGWDADFEMAREEMDKCREEEREWKAEQQAAEDASAPLASTAHITSEPQLNARELVVAPASCKDWRCDFVAAILSAAAVEASVSPSKTATLVPELHVWQTYSTAQQAKALLQGKGVGCISFAGHAKDKKPVHDKRCQSVLAILPHLSSSLLRSIGPHSAILALGASSAAAARRDAGASDHDWIGLTTWDEQSAMGKEKGFLAWAKESPSSSAFLRALWRLPYSSIHGSIDRALVGLDAGPIAARMPENDVYSFLEAKHPGAKARLLAIFQRMGVMPSAPPPVPTGKKAQKPEPVVLPPIGPGVGFYGNRFALRRDSFEVYTKFLALFIAAAEDRASFSSSSSSSPSNAKDDLSALLERLPLIWAYHSGRPLMYAQTFDFLHEQRQHATTAAASGTTSDGAASTSPFVFDDRRTEQLFEQWTRDHTPKEMLALSEQYFSRKKETVPPLSPPADRDSASPFQSTTGRIHTPARLTSDPFYSSLSLPLVFPSSDLRLVIDPSYDLHLQPNQQHRSSPSPSRSTGRVRVVQSPAVLSLTAVPPVLDDPAMPTFAGCATEAKRAERRAFCAKYMKSRVNAMAFPLDTYNLWQRATEGRLWSQANVFEILGDAWSDQNEGEGGAAGGEQRTPIFIGWDGLVATASRVFTFEKVCVGGFHCLVEELRHTRLGALYADGGAENAAVRGEFRNGVPLGWTLQLDTPLALTGAAMLAAYESATPHARTHPLGIQTDHQLRTAKTFLQQLQRTPRPPPPRAPGRIVGREEHGWEEVRLNEAEEAGGNGGPTKSKRAESAASRSFQKAMRCQPEVHLYPALIVAEQYMGTVNYAHFLNEVGPKILLMLPLLLGAHTAADVRLLLQPNSWTLDWVDLAGIPRDRVVFTHPCILHTAERVYLTTPNPLDAPSMQTIALTRSLLMRQPRAATPPPSLLPAPPGAFPSPTFSARVLALKSLSLHADSPYILSLLRPASAARSVTNSHEAEEEVRKAFTQMRVVQCQSTEQQTWYAVDSADYTLSESIHLFRHASAVIGVVGAGFGNMVFLDPRAAVIQIIPALTHARLPCGLTPWWHIAELLHLPLRSFVVEAAHFDGPPFAIPIPEWRAFLQATQTTARVVPPN